MILKNTSPLAPGSAKRALTIYLHSDSTKLKGNTPPPHISFFLEGALQPLISKIKYPSNTESLA
jgi:hypothetical protein